MKNKHEKLINELYDILVRINEEGMNDEEFYEWLNNNYFFKQDLEEIISDIKKTKNSI